MAKQLTNNETLELENSILRSQLRGFNRKYTNSPAREPTIYEIYWAAGIWEGEGGVGSFRKSGTKDRVGLNCSVSQKDRWILERLSEMFGGGISTNPSPKSQCWKWQLCTTRAVDFLCAIAPLLSPRRLQQVRTHIGRFNLNDMEYGFG